MVRLRDITNNNWGVFSTQVISVWEVTGSSLGQQKRTGGMDAQWASSVVYFTRVNGHSSQYETNLP